MFSKLGPKVPTIKLSQFHNAEGRITESAAAWRDVTHITTVHHCHSSVSLVSLSCKIHPRDSDMSKTSKGHVFPPQTKASMQETFEKVKHCYTLYWNDVSKVQSLKVVVSRFRTVLYCICIVFSFLVSHPLHQQQYFSYNA